MFNLSAISTNILDLFIQNGVFKRTYLNLSKPFEALKTQQLTPEQHPEWTPA